MQPRSIVVLNLAAWKAIAVRKKTKAAAMRRVIAARAKVILVDLRTSCNDQIFSSEDDNEYTTSGTSKTESGDGNSSDTEDNSPNRKIGFEYTDEEFEGRRHLSLTLLSGVKFAELDILDEWFEGLPWKQQVNVIWKLMDPSNGGLLLSTRVEWKQDRLQRLIGTLNEALNKGK